MFSTRSPNRPNPIGLHPVEIISIDGTRVLVRNMEAIDGTPILDIKPLLATTPRQPRQDATTDDVAP